MPVLQTPDGARVHFHVDDFRDPWLPEPEEAILMSHGFARSMKWFQGWVPGLARKFRVIRYDVRGCGEYNSVPPGGEWSAELLARDALNLIDHLRIPRIHWVGFESGGIWGIVFAANHPDRIASLTICNTPSASLFRQDQGELAPVLRKATLASDAIKSLGLKGWLTETNGVRLGPLMADPQIAEWHLREHSKTPTEAAVAIHGIAERTDFSPLPPKISVPVLILNSDRSPICPLDKQYLLMQSFPHARMVVFPDVGWSLYLEIPDRCAAAVLQFLENI